MEKTIRFLLFCMLVTLSISNIQAQNTVSGVVLDDNGDSLIGVNILVKGTNRGTVTNIDGKYTINCKVGDVLLFSYTGYQSWEQEITRKDIRSTSVATQLPHKAVEPITSDDYLKAIPSNPLDKPTYKQFPADAISYTGNIYWRNLHKIEISNEKAKLIPVSSPWKYTVHFRQDFNFSYVQDDNLPARQSSFAAGSTINGNQELLHSDALFPTSFGPAFSELSYDGVPNNNWPDGQLIARNIGDGNDIKKATSPLFPSIFSHTTSLTTRITNSVSHFVLNFKNKTGKDVFGIQPFQKNRVGLNYNRRFGRGKVTLGGYFEKDRNKQSNQNGLANHLYQMAYVSPVEFDLKHSFNQQQNQTINNTHFDNPFYLLDNALDQLTNRRYNITAGYNGNPLRNTSILSGLNIIVNTSFTGQQSNLKYQPGSLQKAFGDTISLIEHHYQKPIWRNNLQLVDRGKYFKWHLGIEQYLESIKYQFSTVSTDSGFVPSDQTINRTRNNWQITPRITWMPNGGQELKLTGYNQIFHNSDGSSIWGLPGGSLELSLNKYLKKKSKINNLKFILQANRSVFQQPLIYQNRSWLHQTFSIFDPKPYFYYPELFTPGNLNPEIRSNGSGQFRMTIFDKRLHLDLGAHITRRTDVVLPFGTLENTRLDNAGTLLDHSFDIGVEYQANTGYYSYGRRGLVISWNMNWYRSKVKKIQNNSVPIVIGGNGDVQQVLIENESAGALFGTSFQKNESGALIIDPSGYPLESEDAVLIGDAIPDFVMRFNLAYQLRQFRFSAHLEWSHGGDFWNGTQASLDYLGQSATTASQRNIANFIFPGVQSDGSSNTTPVNFGESRSATDLNRWQRYGPAGVGQEYIQDASYLNLSKIDLSYQSRPSKDFIQQFTLGIYANNLFSWMPARGFSPYRSFREQESNTAFQLFNLPLNTEIGFSFKLKI